MCCHFQIINQLIERGTGLSHFPYKEHLLTAEAVTCDINIYTGNVSYFEDAGSVQNASVADYRYHNYPTLVSPWLDIGLPSRFTFVLSPMLNHGIWFHRFQILRRCSCFSFACSRSRTKEASNSTRNDIFVDLHWQELLANPSYFHLEDVVSFYIETLHYLVHIAGGGGSLVGHNSPR